MNSSENSEIDYKQFSKELLAAIYEEKSLIQSIPLMGDFRASILELTRCLDHSSVYAYHLLDDEHPEAFSARKTFGLIANGFYNGLKCFLDNSIASYGIPFYSSNEQSIHWANSVLLKLGHIGYAEKSLDLVKQGLFKVSKKNKTYTLKNVAPFSGREALSTIDFFWWQSQATLSVEEENELKRLKPIIERQIAGTVEVWNKEFIRYDCTPELDRYYEILGKYFSRGKVGIDSFSLESEFGGLTFGELIDIVDAIMGYALKHRDHCLALLNKVNYKINPWNIYAFPDKIDDLAYSISVHKGINHFKVLEFLKILAVDEKDIQALGDSPGNASPPLIRLSSDYVLKSITGSISNPFAFLTRSLKHHYQDDYFKAVNKREEVFLAELNTLFDQYENVLALGNFNLRKEGKLITDIDASLYDRNDGTLLLVQLKWLDDFAHSLKMRSSMANNFYASSAKWIDKVLNSISYESLESTLSNKTKLFKKRKIHNIKLIILGRNFSHFSDYKEDDRAAWLTWYKLLRIKSENPLLLGQLSNLYEHLKQTSIQNQPLPKMPDQVLQVGDLTIKTIH